MSDRIGRKAAMISIAGIIFVASLIMTSGEGVVFLICIMLIAYGFGGAAGLFPVATTESFGSKHGGINFGLVMLGYGVSALLFPLISIRLTAAGSYTSSFILAAATCLVAIVLVLLMKNPDDGIV
jgi:OFA family oxalate/formate antiporter-like MFS transporter